MASEDLTEEVIERLQELEAEANIAKNIKIRIDNIISILKEDVELSIKTNKALNELDDISNDSNLEPYMRTQIWNIVSILEKINH
ncbi:UPF0147 family protein [Candidatus Woesearchaeota archaeon]|nr:UPF0147 family protein [Candidatus Woesearchaeota archaeon]